MDGGGQMTGPMVVVALGLAALLLAALRDRHTRLDAEQALQRAPERAGLEAPTPSYVTVPDPDSARPLPELPTTLRVEFDELWAIASPTGLRLADERFCTTPDALWLENAHVLCCVDAVGSLRELLDACRIAADSGKPLVIACPELDATTMTTLVVNLYRGSLHSAVLTGEAEACRAFANSCGARAVDAVELQAGVPAAELMGRADAVLARGNEPVRVIGATPADHAPQA